MSLLLIVKEFKCLLVLYLNSGNVLAFLTGVHTAAKLELKSSDFFKSDIYQCYKNEWYEWHFSFAQKSSHD